MVTKRPLLSDRTFRLIAGCCSLSLDVIYLKEFTNEDCGFKICWVPKVRILYQLKMNTPLMRPADVSSSKYHGSFRLHQHTDCYRQQFAALQSFPTFMASGHINYDWTCGFHLTNFSGSLNSLQQC
jgi:hypothetical protein